MQQQLMKQLNNKNYRHRCFSSLSCGFMCLSLREDICPFIHTTLSSSVQHLGGLRGRSINNRGIRFDLIPSTLGGWLNKGGQRVLSFEAKLKRGLAEVTLTTERLRDTNIYAEKPHTHGCTCTGLHGYVREKFASRYTHPQGRTI